MIEPAPHYAALYLDKEQSSAEDLSFVTSQRDKLIADLNNERIGTEWEKRQLILVGQLLIIISCFLGFLLGLFGSYVTSDNAKYNIQSEVAKD